MTEQLERTFSKILMTVANVPEDKIKECLETVSANANSGSKKTLEDIVIEKKLLDPAKVKELKKDAESLHEAPELTNYVLLKKLGQGGMGAVYLAKHVNMGRDVAIKILPQHFARNKAFVDRFYREARSSAKLDHPNVVRGYDVGEENGFHFFAMEFVDGQSAQSVLESQNKMSIGDAVTIAIDVGKALMHAQELNIVHRDIKPDNVMITRKGVVKLADLGLAKQMDEENSMTQTGSGFGTPYYMPPEQARNAKYVDCRSDIYALGASLYRMVTGKYPFDGETAYEVLVSKEKATTAPYATSANAGVPSKLSLVIQKMMDKDPNNRYQRCEEVVEALEALGLHYDKVSFVVGGGTPGKITTTKANITPLPVGNVTEPELSPRSAVTTKPAAGKAKPGKTKPSEDPDIWYLKYKDGNGKLVKTKANTGRVRDSIVKNLLDDNVEASRTPDGPWRRLQAYNEFESYLRTRIKRKIVDKAAAKTADKMSNLIANFDDAQKNYESKKKFKSMISIVIGLVILIAVIGGITFGVMKFMQ